jgi:hypothetical protein
MNVLFGGNIFFVQKIFQSFFIKGKMAERIRIPRIPRRVPHDPGANDAHASDRTVGAPPGHIPSAADLPATKEGMPSHVRDHAPPPGAPGPGQLLLHRAFVTVETGGRSWRDRLVLDRHFSQFGRVLDVFTPIGRKSVAFVSFETNEQLERALAVPHVVSGCNLVVLRAQPVPAFAL